MPEKLIDYIHYIPFLALASNNGGRDLRVSINLARIIEAIIIALIVGFVMRTMITPEIIHLQNDQVKLEEKVDKLYQLFIP